MWAGLSNRDPKEFRVPTRAVAYFGWYALNVLELEPHVIAEQLGHHDGGRLVVQLYGYPDKARARRRIREGSTAPAKVWPLRMIKDESA